MGNNDDFGDDFANGFEYANNTLLSPHNLSKDAMKELLSCVEAARDFGSYNEFDAGIEAAIKQHVDNNIMCLNEDQGGDWYFCEESLSYKDRLTSREFMLQSRFND